jgi:K+-sensing histidine kinase KdpD
MPDSKILSNIKNISLLGELAEYSKNIQKAMNLMEAAEYAYECITSIIPVDLLLIHQKLKGEDASLVFIRTLNDSTITGKLMKQEREIAIQLMAGQKKQEKAVFTSKPPLHYSGTSCNIGNNACCLSMMRVSGEFTNQELGFSLIILQIFMSTILNQVIEDKSRKIGTQELQTQRQNNFISSITHDLRNPLGCIKGYSSTLLREDIDWDFETQKKFLSVIDSEADRLGDMITNMLETARLENGQYELNFDQVSVSALMNTLIEGNRDRHPRLKFNVETPEKDALIMVDTQKIIRAFQNLVDNTVKHTNTLEIWIKIKENTNTIQFFFIDKGEGIPQTRWKSVFNKFSRIPDDSPGTHGSGLGLFIAKQIVIKHGGEIVIDESTSEGTMIRITLPKIPSSAAAVL